MNAPEQARLRMTVPMEVGICCADLDGMLAFTPACWAWRWSTA